MSEFAVLRRPETGDEKIAAVEREIAACESGRQQFIDCPYCGERTNRGDLLCCLTLCKAVRAILQRQTTQELAGKAERIAEAVYSGRN